MVKLHEYGVVREAPEESWADTTLAVRAARPGSVSDAVNDAVRVGAS